MLRNRSLSQSDLVDGIDSSDYKSTSNIYSLHELSSTGNKLPLVIRIDDGFYGKTDWATISSDEILFLYGLKLRKRVLATGADGTRYSFPLDYPLLFIPLQPENPDPTTKPSKSGKHKQPEISAFNEVPSHPKPLQEIVDNHKLPLTAVIDDSYVTFHSSNHDRETVHFGKLTLTHIYDEKYFVGNEIRNGTLSHQITLLPTFLRVKVRLVQGFQKKRKLSWKSAVADWSSTASKINYDTVPPPSDVAAFQSDVVAKVAKSPAKLDSIEPNTYIRLTFLPAEVDHTYEELPNQLRTTHSPEPSVSTFKLATKPSVSRPAIPPFEPSTSDFNPYNMVESPTAEHTSFGTIRSNSGSSHQQQNLFLPPKRLEPRSYSPVPSPPITVNIAKAAPPFLLQKPLNRAPMPLPKPQDTPETQPTPDLPVIVPPRTPYNSFATVDRAVSDGGRRNSYGKNESPKANRPEKRREHPAVPLPPALKPSDLQKALKPAYKSIDLPMNSVALDTEPDERSLPRKPRPQKPRSKTDLSLTTSTLQMLHQERTQQDNSASELNCENTQRTFSKPKYKTPAAKPNKVPFAKIQTFPSETDPDIPDPDISSDYDELCTDSTIQIPPKVKPTPSLPHTNSKSSMPDGDAFRTASPNLPLPPPPKFFQTEYEFPSRDSNSNLSNSEPKVPEVPQLNYEALPTKDETDAIKSIADIPAQLDNLSCFQLADCLRLLNMDSYIITFLANQIDGKLLLELDEEILTSDLKVSKLHAKKLLMFAHRGWRP